MRDIDPKLPAVRHGLGGYSMSDGEWGADDRYLLAWTHSHPQGCEEDALIASYLLI